ncbi:MAG: ABC transporter permease, partial [Lewinella sp.]|nr:ABC transporter permease [Lewinella sp.]
MQILFKIIFESIRQAFQQLRANKLRTFLSLLGISIGIFCIIGVLSAVDSLEDNIRGSMEKLGNDVIYVQKWPWADMGGEWWKYFRRPHPTHDEYELIRDRARSADLTAFFIGAGARTLKWESNSVEQAFLVGVSIEFDRMFTLDFAKGRFFSTSEYHYASNKVVLGAKVAEELFENIEPIGKTIKLQGRPYEVIGVLATSGDELVNPLDFDEAIIVSYPNIRNLVHVTNRRPDT